MSRLQPNHSSVGYGIYRMARWIRLSGLMAFSRFISSPLPMTRFMTLRFKPMERSLPRVFRDSTTISTLAPSGYSPTDRWIRHSREMESESKLTMGVVRSDPRWKYETTARSSWGRFMIAARRSFKSIKMELRTRPSMQMALQFSIRFEPPSDLCLMIRVASSLVQTSPSEVSKTLV